MRPSGAYNTSYARELAIIRTRLQWGLLLLLFLLVVAFPLKPAPFVYLLGALKAVPILGEVAEYDMLVTLSIVIGFTAIAVLGLQLMFGYAGMVSFGHVAFMAVGATSSFLLVGKFGLNFFLALPVVALISGLAGVVFGAAAVRVKGWYLAMVTFAAFFIIMYVLGNLNSTLASLGVLSPGSRFLVRQAPRPSIGGFVFESEASFYYLVMGLLVLMTFLAKNIVRTRTGRAFVAIRDNDIAAEVLGINVAHYKLVAFFIGCAYAGVAGALYAHYVTFITSGFFHFYDNLWLLAMVIIGGSGYILGAILGTIFVKLLFLLIPILVHHAVDLFPVPQGMEGRLAPSLGLIVGAGVFILFLVFVPRGLAHRWERFKATYRLYPFSY